MNSKTRQVLKIGCLVAILVASYFAGYELGYYTTPYVKDSIGMTYNSASTEAAKEAVRREAGILLGVILTISAGLAFFVIIKTRQSRAIGVEEQPKPAAHGLPNKPPVVKEQPETVSPGFSDDITASEEQQKSAALGLLAEIENNLRIANNPQMGELSPFQTRAWDANPRVVHVFPANIQEDLIQAYADIRLANNIVWLATELHRRSADLDRTYLELCAKIATWLSKIMSFPSQANSSSSFKLLKR